MMTAKANISALKIDPEEALTLLKGMIRIRRFEEKCVELYSAGKIRGFLHLYIGEEAVAVGTIPTLKAEDRIVATYREHGQALARGISANAIMAEMFGKASGCCRGRGGSMHLFDASKKFFGGNAIVGGGLPLAVGLALADKMRKSSAITACFFGDGAVAEGEFHESMNLAALWRLPVLFICENNLYAMGTALSRHQSQTDIARKADAYGMKSETVDGMDVFAVKESFARAVDFVRGEAEPFLLVANTYRFRAHSMYDPDLYRPKGEVEDWKQRCPIVRLTNDLITGGVIKQSDVTRIEGDVDAEIAAAVSFAEDSDWEPVADLTRDVCTPQLGEVR